MESASFHILVAVFESFLYSFTMLGVTRRRKKCPPYFYLAFFMINFVFLLALKLSILWHLLLFFFILISSYILIFNVDVKEASYGGTITYILLSINQLFCALLTLLWYKKPLDYRDLFPGLPWPMYFLSFLFAFLMVFVVNICVILPRKQYKRNTWFTEGPVYINLILSVTLIGIMSWNLNFFFKNWENIYSLPGMAHKVIFLLFLVSLAFLGIGVIINRSFIKTHMLYHASKSIKRDSMTGVLNRESGLVKLEELIRHTQQNKTTLTLCFVDINNLKMVNDLFGHHEGDELIRTVSQTIENGLRTEDSVARLGGDEFIVIFDKCDLLKAQVIWGRILERFSAINLSGEKQFPVGISAGFVQYDPQKHSSIKALLREADEKMYREKRAQKQTRTP